MIPVRRTLYSVQWTLNEKCTKHFSSWHKPQLFKKIFLFLSAIIKWNKLDPGRRKALSLSVFKTNIFRFIRPSPSSVYNCSTPKGLKFIRLRLGLSHLREHKFKYSLQDAINPSCWYGFVIESTEHFLIHCPHFVNERCTLLSTICSINYKLLGNTNSVLVQTLLFGNKSFNITDNTKILNAVINLIL